MLRRILLLTGLAGSLSSLSAQQVHVYDARPPALGTTTIFSVTKSDLNQPVLVIPVISQDTPFDPVNNQLAPALLANLQNNFQQTSDFWLENSYGRVSFQATVLDRFYQMPRGLDFYFNPAYVTPELKGTDIGAEPVAVPAGNVRLILHISDADETAITVTFAAAGGPYTYAQLQTLIETAIGPGGKLTLGSIAATHRLDFTVPTTHTQAGTFVHLDYAASNAAVLDALGLDRPNEELGIPRVTGRGAQFPLTTQAGWSFTLTITNDAGTPEAFTWNPPAATYNTAADFVASQGTAVAGATITAAGGELRITLAPTIPGAIVQADFSGTAALLDGLGLDESTEADGVINYSSRNTVKGDRSLIMGQAVAAYMLNELTRPPDPAPAVDPIPNMAITAANKAAIDALMAANIDIYRAIVVVFTDAPNKRAGGAGGYVNAGIDNGGFLYEYQTFASGQIAFDFSDAMTIAHETGHNIGFPDLYNNSDGSYDPALLFPNNWDVMHAQTRFPHTGVWDKELDAGWLTANGAAIQGVDVPAALGATNTGNFVLTPLEFGTAQYDALLAAVPGRTIVKAIRLPLGLGMAANDHFLFISNRQRGATFSQLLPQKAGAPAVGGVYVTDGISRSSFDFFKPTTRNFVHPLSDLPPLATGDAVPILDNAPNPDLNLLASYPAYDGITLNIVGQVAGPAPFNDRPSYLVDITREQKDFLDLRITPWGAPPYESPDIWIEHGNEPLSAVPLPGNGEAARWSPDYDPAANGGVPLNYIRVKVSNTGTVDATGVQVRVKVNTPGGMGDDGTWVTMPLSDLKDIPAGGSAIFDIPWTPRVNRHTCVQAEVYRWNSALGDLDPWNNRTQENVNDFFPTASSPWETMPVEFEVASNLLRPVDVTIEPEGLPRGYILDLDRWYFTIPARSKILVTGTLRMDETIIPPLSPRDPQRRKGDIFHLAAYLVGGDWRIFAGGITLRVFPSVRTTVSVDVTVDAGGNIVVTGTTNPPAPGQHVEVVIRYPSGRYQWVPATTDANGNISVTVPPLEPGNVRVSVDLPPGGPFAPTATGPTMVDTRHPTPGAPGRAGRHQVDLYLGGLWMDDTLAMKSGFETGFRYGYNLRPRFMLELETGLAFTGRPSADGLLGRVQANLRVHPLAATSPVRPFVLIGAGFAWFKAIGIPDDSPLLTWGIGADFDWSSRIGFRLDARDVIFTDLFRTGSTHNIEINWGPTFRF
ncbi:MAG: hypothetical protein AB7I33_07410 [Gemmatimonadales bacterium]